MKLNKQKLLIVLTVFIDVLGIGIIIPVLPFYVGSFNSSPLIMTLLFTVFSLCSFFSAPFLGSLSDKIGRRPVLIISVLSTAIGWIIFASAQSLFFLFIGRIIDGLAAGNFSTAQSYLADIAKDDKERTNNLGLVGAVFGIGFIIGPMLGGFLSAITISFPFWLAGFLAFINALLIWLFLPESLQEKNNKKINFNPFLPIKKSLLNKILLPILSVWLLFNFSTLGMQSIFSLFIKEEFNLGASAAGLFMTLIGLIMALNQTVGLKHFWLKKFKEPNLQFYMLLVLGLGFLVMSLKFFYLFIFGLILNTLAQAVLRVIMTSLIVGEAKNNRGEITGMLSSLSSIAAIFSPIVAGFIFKYNSSYPFLLSAFYAIIAFIIIYFERKKIKPIKLPEDINLITLN